MDNALFLIGSTGRDMLLTRMESPLGVLILSLPGTIPSISSKGCFKRDIIGLLHLCFPFSLSENDDKDERMSEPLLVRTASWNGFCWSVTSSLSSTFDTGLSDDSITVIKVFCLAVEVVFWLYDEDDDDDTMSLFSFNVKAEGVDGVADDLVADALVIDDWRLSEEPPRSLVDS